MVNSEDSTERFCRIFTSGSLIAMGALIIYFAHILNMSIIIYVPDLNFVPYLIGTVGGILVLAPFLTCSEKCREIFKLMVALICIFFLISAILFVFGIVTIYARTRLGEDFSSKEKCIDKFQDIENAVTGASGIMCTMYCPCFVTDQYISSQVLYPEYAHVEGGAIDTRHCNPCLAISDASDSDSQAIINWIQNNLGLNVTKTSCSIESETFKNTFFKDILPFLPALKWIEEKFSCSGFCTAQRFYLFSNINNGNPNGGCLAEIHSWIVKNFLIYAFISVLFGIILVIFM